MQKNKVIILATEGITTSLLYKSLSAYAQVSKVLVEPRESKKTVIKRRIKKIGYFKTFGQLLFLVLILPFIADRKKRVNEIIANADLNDPIIPPEKITHITSVHDKNLPDLIKAENPTLVFINGTRILKKELLDQINCPIINIHVGITPKYRGVHGGYWALYNKDPQLFGVTLHYVDKGIDTGLIIAQKVIQPQPTDNFKTYPILQYVEGIRLIHENYEALKENNVTPQKPLTTESQLHYHPTIWNYLFGKG